MAGTDIAGYYSSWKVYNSCKIEDINPTLCTILIYAFAGLNDDSTIKILDEWADINLGGYEKFNALKQNNSHLRTLLCIGGWNEGSIKYSNMVSTESSRKVFINSCLEFIRTYGFDGIDLNWEYPCQRGGKPEDKDNLSIFLKEARQEFDKHGYLLTMAVGAGIWTIKKSYDVPQLSKHLHFINLMTYDMHSYADGRAGANAPLRSNDSLNVEYCTKAWISHGADPKKILLGIPSYGKSFTLTDKNQHDIGAPTSGPGNPGPISKAKGTLTYQEILSAEASGWTKVWSKEQQIPYAYHEDQWVGYDDTDSVLKKIEFAKQHKLGGIMMWSIDMDDPRGTQGIKYPLLTTIKKNL